MTRGNPMFSVGEKVRIVNANKSRWGSNKDMRAMNGMVVKIKSRIFSEGFGCYRYKVFNDLGGWAWSAECFEPVVLSELPDFEANNADILFGMFM